MANPASTVDQNLLPVQAYFDVYGNFQTFIGQNKPFYATVNPIQSGLTITNSTIDSTTIGANSPSTGVFTNVSATTGQISNTPSSNTDIANKFYVDTVAQGLGPKAACAVATLTNITLSGLQTIDGYTTLDGDRVLVKNQGSSQYNGIYNASASTWTRSTDMDVWSEVPGAYTVVLNGSQADTGWVCTATQTGTINVTAMPWVQFSGSATYFAGTGLTLASNTFSITNTGVSASTYGSASSVPVFAVNAQGQLTSVTNTSIAISGNQITSGTIGSSYITGSYTGITGVGTLTAGTWNASTIGVPYGGTGATTLTGYLKGNGTSPFTAVSAIPTTDLSGTITNAQLANSTISGVALGGSLFNLTAGTNITFSSGTTYNGSAAITINASSTMVYPAAGIANSTGSAWGTSYSTSGTGSVVALATGATLNTPTMGSYETWTATSAPSYAAGRLWYDSTVNSLAYYNDVTNNTLHIGEEIQLKVYNNTGSTINIGQPVYVTSTSSGYTYPNVALAIANSLTTGNVIGLANQNIPTGTAGYVTTIGLIQGLNTGSYTVGDTLYLSPYSAGFFQNTIPPTGYAIKLGTVAYVNSSNGAIYINKSTLSVQAGNIVGQVALSNGGTGANLTASAGGVVYSGASALAISAVGTSGQVLTSSGSGAPTWTNPTAYATVTDDTTTNSTRYPLFANQTSGNISTEYTSSTKLQYNPSTGVFTATQFSGSGAGLTSIPNSALTNSSITIGSTAISLGGSSTTLAGLTSVTSTTFVGALSGNATSATTATAATNATNIGITDNTSSVSTFYPVISAVTTGNTPATTSSTKLSFVPSTGNLTATTHTGFIAPSAGTTSTAPIQFASSGSLLTSATAGAQEFDGNLLYITGNTSTGNGRQIINASQVAQLASSAAVANGGQFFTSSVRPYLTSGNLYKFIYLCVFSTSANQTVTFSFSNSAAVNFTNLNGTYKIIQQGYGTTSIGQMYATAAATTTQQASLSLTSGNTYMAEIEGYVVPSASTRLQLLVASASGITSQLGSYFVLTDLGSGNIGNIA